MLEVSVLGGFEASLDGRRLEGFESDKVRALLAYLAVESGRWHRREHLAALLWPDKPAEAALHRLRQALCSLRAVLHERGGRLPSVAGHGSAVTGVAGESGAILAIGRTEIRLDPGCAVWLDVAAVTQLLNDCDRHQHRPASACRACLRRMEGAAALCRGAFLEGLSVGESEAFEEWVTGQRQRVEARLVPALERLAEWAERRHDLTRAQEHAQRRLRLEPWAEEGHRRLMRVLAWSGRRSAALRQYQRCRHVLEDELGIEPSPETQRLACQIECGDAPAPAEPPHNLPAPLTACVGRESEIGMAEELLSSERLVTLTGARGCGKSRLALEVASRVRHDFAGGVWLVELTRGCDPAQVPLIVARALGIAEVVGRCPVQLLAAHLRGEPALLVLDNCEYAIGACAALADQLLRACATLCILATSREALRIAGEHVREVPALPPLARLSLERSVASEPGMALTTQVAPVLSAGASERFLHSLAYLLFRTLSGRPGGMLPAQEASQR